VKRRVDKAYEDRNREKVRMMKREDNRRRKKLRKELAKKEYLANEKNLPILSLLEEMRLRKVSAEEIC
jgi:hypothetical protein